MAEVSRGLPLLSGPPPVLDTTGPDACRKCNKEFNILFTRSRRCNHCGYSYCHSCTDFTALMPRTGNETGYDSVNVCGYCIEYLQITAASRNHLKSMSLAKLKNYLSAYDIKTTRVVEKDDLIDAILNARQPDGCLPRANENYYRTHSVPAKSSSRPRGLFSSRNSQQANVPPPRVPPRPSAAPQPEFARPDLEPDHPPPSSSYPPRAPPQSSQSQSQPQYRNAYPQYTPQQQQQHYQPPPQQYQQPSQQQYTQPQNYYNPPPPRPHSAYPTPTNAGGPPPPQFHTPPPQNVPYTPYHGYGYPQQQQQQQQQQYQPYPQYQSRQQAPPRPNPPPRETRPPPPQAAPAPPPAPPIPPTRPRAPSATPPPSLDQLLNMTHESIRGLSIGALKEILFTNHVNAGQILEKSDLVQKVFTLVDAERKERERQRQAEEREEMERVQRLEEARRQREERERAEEHGHETGGGDGDTSADMESGPGADGAEGTTPPVSSSPPKSTAAPPPTKGSFSSLERTGLCVICQDEEANIAIVDCGHMAMCRECADLIMSSSRECPLCRTRIITEQRLLRIYKT